MTDSETKRILVTGASRGIGRAIAIRLAADGYAVVVHYGSNEAAADDVVSVIMKAGGSAHKLGFDVAERAAVLAALENDMTEHGSYYAIVSNAGVTRDAAFPMLTGDDWDTVLRTNLDGFFNVVNPCIMPMIRRKKAGRIVVISSVSGIVGNRGQVNYSASKAGLIGAAKALGLELAKRKITVNCVAPGLIATDMTHDLPQQELEKMIPMRRMGEPEDIASMVAFLCSDEAAYITRQVIAVDGGLS
jgi:3-oxoacyl-[acyl-carrier protein] reductase